MPQYLVNRFAERIARGEMRAAMIVGGEALRTQHGVERRGLDDISWREDPGGEPELIGDPRRGWSDDEDKHNIRAAITLYPLIENAIRGRRGASIPDHLKRSDEHTSELQSLMRLSYADICSKKKTQHLL